MATLLLRLSGPMQSWGTSSRFLERDSGREPSKSGVIGLVCAALGLPREEWMRVEPLTRAGMAVRHDRPGLPRRDYQTARDVIAADASTIHPTAETTRHYLADATFLVGLELGDTNLLEAIHDALRNPSWPLYLGRRSYVPADPVWLEDGLQEGALREVMLTREWLGALRSRWERRPERLLATFESPERRGTMVLDQLAGSFLERRFTARYVVSEWIPFPGEAVNVAEQN